MVLWPGLGRREEWLPTSEDATACSSLNRAARCILFTVPRACIPYFWFSAADWLIVQIRRFTNRAISSLADLLIVRSACFVLLFVLCRRFANCATEPPICCFCDLLACRSAYRTICSLVAEFALMVYGYRIILLRGRWPITFVIRGKTSSFILRLYAGVTGIAEILFDFSLFVIRRSLKKNRNTKANKV